MIRTIASLLMFISLSVQAKPIPALTDFTAEQVKILSTALAEADEPDSRSFDDWVFKRFFLRVTAKVALDIEAIKLELLPELELVWQKES